MLDLSGLDALLAPAPAAAAPIVKWVGGKTKLFPELLARMPRRFGRYFEPFAGGAALFFRAAPAPATLGDMNLDLITVYSCVKHDVECVIRNLEQHASNHCRAYYYAERDRWNDWRPGCGSAFERAASFIYFNKTCFNGLWRVNRDGEFNVPMGAYKNPRICDAPALRAAARALAGATLVHGDYRATLASVCAGDFVYFDPPYDATFTDYTADSFGQQQQRELAACARHLASHGVQVMLSNSSTPFVRELYAGFRIETVMCGRAVNSDGAKRGPVPEVIIRSY